MRKRWLLISLVALLMILFFACSKAEKQKEIEYLPEGAVIAYEDYMGYKVPILADGKGGQVRWMADVPWELLPIETRMKFAAGGGGHLSIGDLLEMWEKFGEWKKTGIGQDIEILLYDEGDKLCLP